MKNRNLNKIYRDKKKYPSNGMPYKSKKKTYTGKNFKKKSKNTKSIYKTTKSKKNHHQGHSKYFARNICYKSNKN